MRSLFLLGKGDLFLLAMMLDAIMVLLGKADLFLVELMLEAIVVLF